MATAILRSTRPGATWGEGLKGERMGYSVGAAGGAPASAVSAASAGARRGGAGVASAPAQAAPAHRPMLATTTLQPSVCSAKSTPKPNKAPSSPTSSVTPQVRPVIRSIGVLNPRQFTDCDGPGQCRLRTIGSPLPVGLRTTLLYLFCVSEGGVCPLGAAPSG